MSIGAVLGVALVTVAAGRILRQYNPSVGLAVSLTGGGVLLLGCLARLQPLVASVKELLSLSQIDMTFFSLLLKALGICYLCQFAGDLCRDAGETALAGYVELSGKMIVLGLSLPMVRQVVETVVKLVST